MKEKMPGDRLQFLGTCGTSDSTSLIVERLSHLATREKAFISQLRTLVVKTSDWAQPEDQVPYGTCALFSDEKGYFESLESLVLPDYRALDAAQIKLPRSVRNLEVGYGYRHAAYGTSSQAHTIRQARESFLYNHLSARPAGSKVDGKRSHQSNEMPYHNVELWQWECNIECYFQSTPLLQKVILNFPQADQLDLDAELNDRELYLRKPWLYKIIQYFTKKEQGGSDTDSGAKIIQKDQVERVVRRCFQAYQVARRYFEHGVWNRKTPDVREVTVELDDAQRAIHFVRKVH